MAGGEPRLGTTATYMRHNDHGATHLSTKIDRLHDRLDNEYEVFSAGSVKKWSKFGLGNAWVLRCGWRRNLGRAGLRSGSNGPCYAGLGGVVAGVCGHSQRASLGHNNMMAPSHHNSVCGEDVIMPLALLRS